ncbi:MAG TPA: restriction endonuclease subunit S [Alphaproteobacteria bacterium]|nr:restriction endonuclease subunit S [Alphaproteobacteria bacterium]
MSTKWPMVKLGEVLTRSEETIALRPDVEYHELTVKLWGKGVVLRGIVRGAEVAASRRFIAKAGQFVLSRIDARNGALGLVPEELDGAIVTNDFPVFTLDETKLLPAFLGWMSRTADFLEKCRRASEGTTNRVRLQEGRFLELEIPLPPLSEQRRIVARIEALAGQIKEARRLRREAVEETEALLAAALRRITVSLNAAGRLGDVLISPPRNGWSARCDNANGGTPVLALSAVTGYRYRRTEYKRTSLYADPNAHFWLKPGDILITRSNTPELVGHAAIYDGEPLPCIYPDLMMRLEPDSTRVEGRFVWYWLQCPVARDFIREHAKGTSSSMKKISQETVMAIPFPVILSLKEQRRIIAELDALQAEVDRLKALQAETATELDALLPAIFDRAFRGEL